MVRVAKYKTLKNKVNLDQIKRIIDNEDLTYVKPAHLVARNLKEGWLNMPEESRQIN